MSPGSLEKTVSIVVPVFNEAENVEAVYERVFRALDGQDLSAELIYVDDGSSDGSPDVVSRLSDRDSRVKLVSLSRNFGHQIALTAGFDHASGDAVITMDGDLQHPPEMIPTLLELWRGGFDIVNTVREDPPDIPRFKKWTADLYYFLINKLSGVHVVKGGADFRLVDRQAVQGFVRIREHDRFIRGLVPWLGFRQTFITYRAGERVAGATKYSFRKMLRLALDGITSFSVVPLRLSLYLGVITALSGFVYGAYAIFIHFMGKALPGWTSVFAAGLLWGGVMLIIQGIIGEYIGRIYMEVKDRPLYLIRETRGLRPSDR